MTTDDTRREHAGPSTSTVSPARPADGRARRRRNLAVLVVAATVAAVLVGGFALRHRLADQPQQSPVAWTEPSATGGGDALPWLSAMVARDGRNVTVYAGPGRRCTEFSRPKVTTTEQDDARVTIAVNSAVVAAADCTTSDRAVPLTVLLPAPLGDRVLRDAATGQPRPTYFERDLPDLAATPQWSPFSASWDSTDAGWYASYNGPGGSALHLSAQSTAESPGHPATGSSVRLGSQQGTITSSGGTSWTVWWEAGDVTYSLRMSPVEGDSLTLDRFTRELARLEWN